jgi:hypothetical protein
MEDDRVVWETQRKSKIKRKRPDITEDELDRECRRRYSQMLKHTRRCIPLPVPLKNAVSETIRVWGMRRGGPKNEPLLSQTAWEELDKLIKHIESGCWSDHPDHDLYFTSPHDPTEKVVWCARGTSALEGWHKYLRQCLGGSNVAPFLALLIIAGVIHRWNIRTGVSHRGMSDFGSYDTIRLLRLKMLDSELALLSAFRTIPDTNDFLDTKERFGLVSGEAMKRAASVFGVEPDHLHSTWNVLDSEDEEEPSSSNVVGSAPHYDVLDSSTDESDEEHEPSCVHFRITQAQRDLHECLGVPHRAREIGFMQPRAPTGHEKDLFRRLQGSCVLMGGDGEDLNKMLVEWNDLVVRNHQLPMTDVNRKEIRCATILSLEDLKETISWDDKRKAMMRSVRNEDSSLRKDLRDGDREGTQYRQKMVGESPRCQPVVTPDPNTLRSGAQFFPPVYTGVGMQREPWVLRAPMNVTKEGCDGLRKKRPKTCSVCGMCTQDVTFKTLHGHRHTKKHLDTCPGPTQCPIFCNPDFCRVPLAQYRRQIGVKRSHKKNKPT